MPEQENKAPNISLAAIMQPRFLLLVWGGIGALFLAFILINAMVPKSSGPAGHADIARNLLKGEMAAFTPAFPPREAPVTPFTGPNGETALRDFRGEVVLVNLWATWCAPCLEEMPSLNALQKQFEGEDFRIVAIAAEPRAEEKALRFFEAHGIDALELYSDPTLGFAMNMGGADRLPLSVLYDRRGREIGRLMGSADWQSPEAAALIRAVLAGQDIS